MIENGDQLRQAYEALGDLYRALASYRERILPANPRNYALIAQGPLEEVRRIQGEIDAYLGLREPAFPASESAAGAPASALRETPRPCDRETDTK
jgi:hypothetical protein